MKTKEEALAYADALEQAYPHLRVDHIENTIAKVCEVTGWPVPSWGLWSIAYTDMRCGHRFLAVPGCLDDLNDHDGECPFDHEEV